MERSPLGNDGGNPTPFYRSFHYAAGTSVRSTSALDILAALMDRKNGPHNITPCGVMYDLVETDWFCFNKQEVASHECQAGMCSDDARLHCGVDGCGYKRTGRVIGPADKANA